VRDVVENPRSRAVVSGIVSLAAGFGQRTIAEGVENATTLAVLRSLGVDLVQGFHIGRPAPIELGEE
jgi:EAL domain-containing protein (putative c-di-GMP-specific phosphodiesterase class I)